MFILQKIYWFVFGGAKKAPSLHGIETTADAETNNPAPRRLAALLRTNNNAVPVSLFARPSLAARATHQQNQSKRTHLHLVASNHHTPGVARHDAFNHRRLTALR